MDSLLNRYRNITVLLFVVAAQLILLAVQVRNDRDIPFIRVWTITAVTPFARFVEAVRGGTVGFVRDYVHLHDADAENRRLREEVGRLKLDNIFLRNELNQADRVKALQMFQAETQSKTLAARVFGVGAAASAKMVLVDRGSIAGVQRGMAVVTPDGIVGKVIAAYPTASQVLLVTDPDFAAGVISQKNQARGDLKGTGKDYCVVDYVPPSEKVEVGEWFYTSGDDRIFPRGFPAGVVKEVRDGTPFKEILVEPSGPRRGLEDVLIVLNGVHQEIPKTPPSNQPVYIAPPVAPTGSTDSGATGSTGATAGAGTEADRLRARYKAIGDAQNHIFGEGLPGSKPPNFNLPAGGSTGATGPAAASGSQAVSAATGAKGAPAATGAKVPPKGPPSVTELEDGVAPAPAMGAPAATEMGRSGEAAGGVKGASPANPRGIAPAGSTGTPAAPSARYSVAPADGKTATKTTGTQGGAAPATGAKGTSPATKPRDISPSGPTGANGPTGGPPR
jgi:rod shape-determining protein MreC